VYEVAISHVEAMERQLNRYMKRWLGVPKSLTYVGIGWLVLPNDIYRTDMRVNYLGNYNLSANLHTDIAGPMEERTTTGRLEI